jgi:hypothetical protein
MRTGADTLRQGHPDSEACRCIDVTTAGCPRPFCSTSLGEALTPSGGGAPHRQHRMVEHRWRAGTAPARGTVPAQRRATSLTCMNTKYAGQRLLWGERSVHMLAAGRSFERVRRTLRRVGAPGGGRRDDGVRDGRRHQRLPGASGGHRVRSARTVRVSVRVGGCLLQASRSPGWRMVPRSADRGLSWCPTGGWESSCSVRTRRGWWSSSCSRRGPTRCCGRVSTSPQVPTRLPPTTSPTDRRTAGCRPAPCWRRPAMVASVVRLRRWPPRGRPS